MNHHQPIYKSGSLMKVKLENNQFEWTILYLLKWQLQNNAPNSNFCKIALLNTLKTLFKLLIPLKVSFSSLHLSWQESVHTWNPHSSLWKFKYVIPYNLMYIAFICDILNAKLRPVNNDRKVLALIFCHLETRRRWYVYLSKKSTTCSQQPDMYGTTKIGRKGKNSFLHCCFSFPK